ncbi:MAG: DUF6048 family protein [Bacteroidales bacterium]|nr:DUF6048 family protein [Bacteroidales bacterium]
MSSSTYKTLLFCLFFPMTFSVSAADKKKEKAIDIPLYQGIQIGFDVIPPLGRISSDNYGAGIKADINLKNKYFPTLEVGFAHFDKTSDLGINCTSSGQYIKIGVNKALSYNENKAENLFFAGAHYGFSSFSYNLDNLVYFPGYWGSNIPFSSIHDEKAVAGWIELVAGVRVNVLGPVSLGWTAQYKSTLNVTNGSNSTPAYIPGYGQNFKPKMGIALHLYYKLPF